MKIKTNNIVIALNILVSILFIIPITKLDLFKENYSTLSLTTRGYLYVLFLGIIIGSLLGYETYKISNKKRGIIMFFGLFIGTIIPHHVPYNIQGNLHLIFAYIGFSILVIVTILNICQTKLMNFYLLFIFTAILIYLKYSMVNTLSEVIVMIVSLISNMIIYLKMNN